MGVKADALASVDSIRTLNSEVGALTGPNPSISITDDVIAILSTASGDLGTLLDKLNKLLKDEQITRSLYDLVSKAIIPTLDQSRVLTTVSLDTINADSSSIDTLLNTLTTQINTTPFV